MGVLHQPARSASSASCSVGGCCRRGARRTPAACPIRSASCCWPPGSRSPRSRIVQTDEWGWASARFVVHDGSSPRRCRGVRAGAAAGWRTRCSTSRCSSRRRSAGPTPRTLVFATGSTRCSSATCCSSRGCGATRSCAPGWRSRSGPLIVAVDGTAVRPARRPDRPAAAARPRRAGVGARRACCCSPGATITPDYVGHYLPAVVLSGIGVALCLPQLSSAAVQGLPPDRFGSGSAVTQAVRNLGRRSASRSWWRSRPTRSRRRARRRSTACGGCWSVSGLVRER